MSRPHAEVGGHDAPLHVEVGLECIARGVVEAADEDDAAAGLDKSKEDLRERCGPGYRIVVLQRGADDDVEFAVTRSRSVSPVEASNDEGRRLAVSGEVDGG